MRINEPELYEKQECENGKLFKTLITVDLTQFCGLGSPNFVRAEKAQQKNLTSKENWCWKKENSLKQSQQPQVEVPQKMRKRGKKEAAILCHAAVKKCYPLPFTGKTRQTSTPRKKNRVSKGLFLDKRVLGILEGFVT